MANYDNIPKALTDLPNWVLWRLDPRKTDPDGKPTKPLYNAHRKHGDPVHARSTVPSTWSSFAEACESVKAFKPNPVYADRQDLGLLKGIGFCLLGTNIIGIDLDHCIDDAGSIASWALETIESLNSYTEISPSGHGFRIFINGCNLPCKPFKNEKAILGSGIEIYDGRKESGRYMTVTGNVFGGFVTLAGSEAQSALNAVCEKYRTDKAVEVPKKEPVALKPKAAGMEMTWEEARSYVDQRCHDILQMTCTRAQADVKGEPTYICPFCGHGTREHKWGMVVLPADSTHPDPVIHCPSCGDSGREGSWDAIGFYAKLRSLEYDKAAKEMFEYFGLKVTDEDGGFESFKAFRESLSKAKKDKEEVAAVTITVKDTGASGLIPASEASEAMEYLINRGLSEQVVEAYKLTYNPVERRVVIPCGENYYVARAIDPKAQPRYLAPKDGTPELFNDKALHGDKPVFVVEGTFDALAILDAGYPAVALLGTKSGKLVEAIEHEMPRAQLLLSLDNEKGRAESQEKMVKKLLDLGVNVYSVQVAGDYKDASQHWEKDPEAMKQTLKAIVEEVETKEQQRLEEHQKLRVDNLLLDFMDRYEETFAVRPIRTGFRKLDSWLCGGLTPGIYCVGALSGLGKSTFCLNMAANMAEAGTDVLFFSLEMSASTLVTKLLSRGLLLTNVAEGDRTTENCKTALDLIIPENLNAFTDLQRERMIMASQKLMKTCRRLYICEGNSNYTAFTVDQIIEKVQDHIKATGNKPVVFVDYLQILKGKDPRATDKQNTDDNVTALIQLARKFKISIVIISSLNRQNYDRPIDQGAFKESGIIEYSADALLGLQYFGAGTSGFDLDNARAQQPRDIELRVIKGRLVDSFTKIRFSFMSRFNFYTEVD